MVRMTGALYEIEAAKMQRIRVEEGRLREEIEKLDAQCRQADASSMEVETMRRLGADVLWQTWVGRRKQDLNMRLANVLARKQQLAAGLAQAHGKHVVVQDMRAHFEKSRRERRIRAQLARDLELSLLDIGNIENKTPRQDVP